MISALSFAAYRHDREVGMPALPLYDDHRDAFVSHLDGVRMAELMWRYAPADVRRFRRSA